MHLSIKYLLYSSGKPNPLPPPPSQLPAQVLTMSPKADGIYSFLFSDYLSPSCGESAGVGNYVKAEFCFILFHYAYEREN